LGKLPEALMAVRSILAVAVLAASIAPAAAADLVGQPLFSCGPPPAALAAPVATKGFRGWAARPDQQRIVDVNRFDPPNPQTIVPQYVTPTQAFLASPVCQFPDGVSTRSWYDGQLFYKQGGSRVSPDTFMVIERK